MSSNRLRIERHDMPGVITFVLAGELDLGAVGCVETVLDVETASTGAAVALDLSQLELIDLAGIDLLVAFASRLALQGRSLRLVASNPVVGEAFELAGVQLVATADAAHLFVPTRRSSRVPDPQPLLDPGHDSRPSTPPTTAAPLSR